MPAGGPELVVLSGRTRQELTRSMDQLADFLRRNPEAPAPAIARTLQLGRKQFQYRISFVASHQRIFLISFLNIGIKTNHRIGGCSKRHHVCICGRRSRGLWPICATVPHGKPVQKEVDACLEKVQNAFQQDVLSFFKACISAPETYREEEIWDWSMRCRSSWNTPQSVSYSTSA